MDDTGRIKAPISATARRLVFAPPTVAELERITEVDRAHLVMLAEGDLVPAPAAADILGEISALRRFAFEPLLGRDSRRGVYLLYEDHMVERLGPYRGGLLRTARSRNDLNATVFLLGLRESWAAMVGGLARLSAVLLSGARRHDTTLMPAYTHHQAALPTTYGHYLAGVATAVDRDIEGCLAAAPGLDTCPLGAGAGAGTTWPINPARTAALLGFSGAVGHPTAAVATREPALRLTAAAAVAGVTVSRLVADLTAWTTAEFGFLVLPDPLVGSSSLMPQKRNPFLLEHAKGRAAAPLGTFVTAATAAHATPFANSIAAGAEATAGVPGALRALGEAATLCALVVAGAVPDAAAMASRLEGTTATYAADRLAAAGGSSYGEAHRLIGSLLSSPGARAPLPEPAEALAASRYGGGPGRPARVEPLRARRAAAVAHLGAQRRRWALATDRLEATVTALCRGAGGGAR